jgi:hypothetical protein
MLSDEERDLAAAFKQLPALTAKVQNKTRETAGTAVSGSLRQLGWPE